MADFLSEEMAGLGHIRRKDGEMAISQVMNAVMDGMTDGVFEIVREDTA